MIVNTEATDSGTAQLLLDNNVDSYLQYKDGEWLIWDSSWSNKGLIPEFNKICQQLRAFSLSQSKTLSDGSSQVKTIFPGLSHARKLESKRGIEQVLYFCAGMPEFNIGKWDKDPGLFGIANGVIDLEKMSFRVQQKSDWISVSSEVSYNPNAKCPRWNRFIKEVIPNNDTRNYLQKALGAGLTRSTNDQLFHFWLGAGSNGKGVLKDVVSYILGPMCGVALSSLFIRTPDDSANRFTLSRLVNARLIFASEVPRNRTLEEYRIKQLTGEDAVVVEEKFKPQQEATLVGTIMMLVNEIPTISDQSYAMRRRLRVIPFTEEFDPAVERNLRATLISEAEGVLLWLLEGAYKWYKEGIGYPESIKEATEGSFKSSFMLHDFFKEVLQTNPNGQVYSAALRSRYTKWAKERNLREYIADRPWGDAIRAFMEPNYKKKEATDGWVYEGWELKKEEVMI